MRYPAVFGVASGSCQVFLSEAERFLEVARVENPRWTAEQLLSGRLQCQPVELYLEPPPISEEQKARFRADLAARANGVPLQYLTGSAGFYGRDFFVGPGVFIPRPETEVLVDTVLYLCGHLQVVRGGSRLKVADIGAGSGAIAVTVALERQGTAVFAVERSTAAISFARRNAERHQAEVLFLQGSLLAPLSGTSLDLIASNLPYLNPEEAAGWPKELHWEPWLALDGGDRGIFWIQELLRQAPPVLSAGGKIVLEIGEGHAGLVRQAAHAHGFEVERIVHDLAGLDRVVVLKEKSS